MSRINSRHFLRYGAAAALCAAVMLGAHGAARSAPSIFALDTRQLEVLGDPGLAMKQSDLDLLLLKLKNAVREKPKDGKLRGQLGLALLRAGDAISATRELRQAQHDGGPDNVIVPGLIAALLQRGQQNDVLQEFSELSPSTGVTPDILMGRAMALQALGRANEAKPEADRALALRRDTGLLVARGTLAMRQNDLPLARRLAAEAIKLSPNNDNALILEISVLLHDQGLSKALAEVNSFAARVPDSSNALALRVEVLLAMNRDDLASQAVDSFEDLAPDAPLGTYYTALLAARAKDVKGAWDNAQNLPPEFILSRPEVAISVAEMAIADRNLETARAILAALVSRRPDAEEARFMLAALQLGIGAADAALKTLQPVAQDNRPSVQILLAQTYLQLRRYRDAVTALERSRAADGNDAIKRQLAISLFEYGDTDKSVSELQQLFARQKTWAVAAPLIEALLQTGSLDQASAVVEQMRGSGQPVLLEFYRGQVLSARGALDAATEHYGKALSFDPKFLPALYYRAQVLVMRGDAKAAREDLNQVIANDPKDTPAYLQLAQISLNESDFAGAGSILDKAMKANPKDVVPRLALAKFQLARGDLSSASATIEGILAQFPNDPEALSLQGQWRLAEGQPKKALDSFLSMAASRPNSAAAYVVLAKAFDTVSDHTAAIDAAQKAVELAPFSIEAHSLLVGLLIIGNRADDALRVAREFASTHPSAAADALLAETLARLKRGEEAKHYLDQRFAAQPSSLLVVKLSLMTMGGGDVAGAQRLLSTWLAKHPDDFPARLAYASTFQDTGDKPNARRELEILLRQRPEDPLVLNDLAWLIQDNDLPRAISLLSLAMRVAPASPQIADSLGWLKLKTKDAEGAVRLLQRARDVDSTDGEIGYHLALALHEAGKKAEAKKMLQSVLAQSASFADAASARNLLTTW